MNQVATDPVKLVMVDALHRIATISGKQTIGHHIADDHCLAEARKLGLHFGQGIKLGDVMTVADFDEPLFAGPSHQKQLQSDGQPHRSVYTCATFLAHSLRNELNFNTLMSEFRFKQKECIRVFRTL